MLREPGEIVRELKREQERRLERVESDDFRILRQFAIETGLRVREYAPLTWDQVDFTAGTIDVIQKGNRRRVIPMTDHIRSLLNSRRGHHPKFVFTYVATLTHHVGKHRELREKGKRYPISISWAQEKLTAYFRKAEIDDFRVHDLRHTAATRILRATQNLRAAQLLLGHADISSTERYAHLQTDDLLAAMNRRDAYYESPNAL
jgi:integrase